MSPKLCAFLTKGSVIRFCPALAMNGSSYCPAHQALGQGVTRPVPVPVDPDADVLPWQDSDQAIFSRAAARVEAARAARRAGRTRKGAMR
jgi:hypothetical protein